MRRRNHKANPVPGGHVRRTGPRTCSVGVLPGMPIEYLAKLRLAARLFAVEVPYGLDVSWALWAEFIEHNHQWQPVETYCVPGDCLMPDDAAAFLQAMANHYDQSKLQARTY